MFSELSLVSTALRRVTVGNVWGMVYRRQSDDSDQTPNHVLGGSCLRETTDVLKNRQLDKMYVHQTRSNRNRVAETMFRQIAA